MEAVEGGRTNKKEERGKERLCMCMEDKTYNLPNQEVKQDHQTSLI